MDGLISPFTPEEQGRLERLAHLYPGVSKYMDKLDSIVEDNSPLIMTYDPAVVGESGDPRIVSLDKDALKFWITEARAGLEDDSELHIDVRVSRAIKNISALFRGDSTE